MSYKKIIGLVAVVSLLAALGWAFVLPSFTNSMANEKLSDIVANKPSSQTIQPSEASQPAKMTDPIIKNISSGTFRSLNNRSVSGEVSVVEVEGKTYIRLEDNFSVTNGPDLLVGLGNNDSVQELITGLKANSGGQNYLLPDHIDIKKFSQIFIHCRAFKYSFAVADLQIKQ